MHDALLTGGETSRTSGAELAATWEEGLRPIHALHHQAGNYRVTVQGNEAEAFCYGTATHYRPTVSGHNIRTFVDSYDFNLSRLDGRWRITTFRFNCKFIDGNVDLDKSE